MSWNKAEQQDKDTVNGYIKQNYQYNVPALVVNCVLVHYYHGKDYFDSESPDVKFIDDDKQEVMKDEIFGHLICGNKVIDLTKQNNKQWKWRIKVEGRKGICVGIQSIDKDCAYHKKKNFCWCHGNSCLLTYFGAVQKQRVGYYPENAQDWILNFGDKETILDIIIKKCDFRNSGYYIQFDIIKRDEEVVNPYSYSSTVRIDNIQPNYYQLVIVLGKVGQKAKILQGPKI